MLKLKWFFCIVLLSGYQIAWSAESTPLRLVISNWAPYKSGELLNGGVATDITRQALERAGYQVEILNAPWKRALIGAGRGVYDVLPAIWSSPEREKTLHFSDPVLDSRVVVIWLDSYAFEYRSLDDLKDQRVGVGRGWSYPEAFEKADFFTREPVVDLEANFRRLFANRLNLIVGEELASRYTVAQKYQHLSDRVRYSNVSLQDKPLRVAFSRQLQNYAQISDRFNAALDAMRKDGSYQQLLEQHGVGVVQTPLSLKRPATRAD